MVIVTLYVTFPNEKTTVSISKTLIKEKLVACANFFPIKSMFWWKEKIQYEDEIAVLFKTTKEAVQKASARIVELHPYEVPCIEVLDGKANDAYEEWVEKSVTFHSE